MCHALFKWVYVYEDDIDFQMSSRNFHYVAIISRCKNAQVPCTKSGLKKVGTSDIQQERWYVKKLKNYMWFVFSNVIRLKVFLITGKLVKFYQNVFCFFNRKLNRAIRSVSFDNHSIIYKGSVPLTLKYAAFKRIVRYFDSIST